MQSFEIGVHFFSSLSRRIQRRNTNVYRKSQREEKKKRIKNKVKSSLIRINLQKRNEWKRVCRRIARKSNWFYFKKKVDQIGLLQNWIFKLILSIVNRH